MPDILSSDFSEPGFLKRLRNWRDAMPWLAMGECFGPATSLVALSLSLIALLLGGFGVFSIEWVLRDNNPYAIPSAAHFPPSLDQIPLDPVQRISDPFDKPVLVSAHQFLTSPIRLVPVQDSAKVWMVRLMQQFFLFAIWCIPAGYVMRQTVLAISGRERMATLDTLKLVCSRYLSFLAGPTLTLGFALFLCTYFVLVGLVDRIPMVGHPMAIVGSLIGLPVALAIGILGLGTLLTFPLMWASVVTESYSDGFDSASRGFEYVIQRPFRFCAYLLIAIILSTVAYRLFDGIVEVGTLVANRSFQSTSVDGTGLPAAAAIMLQSIPIAFVFNLFWAFSAGIYLMLRRDANHQEIEDIWEPERPKAKPLPDLGDNQSDDGKPSTEQAPTND